jgi:hypothetical protein
MSGTPQFSTIGIDAFGIWNHTSSSITAQDVIKKLGLNLKLLGRHYYVPNPNTTAGSPAISPKWDFTSDAEKGNVEAFVIGGKVGDLPAPTGKNDVDWVQLKKVEGELANTVYRVETKGGQPPTSVGRAEN